MTVEEALVALLAVVASLFLILGLGQALGVRPTLSGRVENRRADHRIEGGSREPR
jgi:uncharacterized membrane protein YGL010W